MPLIATVSELITKRINEIAKESKNPQAMQAAEQFSALNTAQQGLAAGQASVAGAGIIGGTSAGASIAAKTGGLSSLEKIIGMNALISVGGSVLSGEAREWLQGTLQTGEVRYTAALAMLEISPPNSDGARIGENEARKSMTAMGLSQEFQEAKIAESKLKAEQFAGLQQTGQQMNIPRLPNESNEQYATRVYAAEKSQMEEQQKTQTNLKTTGVASGQVNDLTGEQLESFTRLKQTQKKLPVEQISPIVREKIQQLEATQTAQGRMKTMAENTTTPAPITPQPLQPIPYTPAPIKPAKITAPTEEELKKRKLTKVPTK